MFNATATTEIYTYGHTLSLHVALPILFGARVAPGSGHEFRRIDDPQIRCPQFAFQPFGRHQGVHVLLLSRPGWTFFASLRRPSCCGSFQGIVSLCPRPRFFKRRTRLCPSRCCAATEKADVAAKDRKSTRMNSSH